MGALVIFLVFLSLLFLFCSLPVVESIIMFFISTPILFFLFTFIGCGYTSSYLASILSVLSIILLLSKIKNDKVSYSKVEECSCFLIFIVSFIILYLLSLGWADFITIGERLRDYSILSSVIKFPIELQEPWFAGGTLNYYAFWYRMGSMIAFIFNTPVWNTYHIMVAFNTSLFFTLIFIIVKKYLNFTFLQSLFLSFIVFPGCSYRAIKFFFSNDNNWWGPSRVIKGAITEFPTWSFVLGDLHPHFLNLLCFPFFILLMLFIDPMKWNIKERILFFIFFLIVPPLFIFNANAWDIPVYCLFFVTYLVAVCILRCKYNKKFNSENVLVVNKKPYLLSLGLILVFFISLFLSSRNIMSVGASLKFVAGEVARTNTNEFIDAFGIPFFLIFCFLIFLHKNKYKNVFIMLLIFSLTFLNLAIYPIFILFLFNLSRIIGDLDENYRESTPRKNLLFDVVGIGVFILWLVPEIIYFNDNYGAGNERMNTIFKIYSATWSLSYIYAFYLLKRVVDKYDIKNSYILWSLIPVTIICVLPFFKFIGFRQFQYSASLSEKQRGLFEVEKIYRGAKNTISKLTNMPDGIVIESTKGAYNYASHVSTLSGKTSYLGWQNHIQLLYKNYDEVRKRKENIDNFYTKMNCNERKDFLKVNNITYVVLGPLEKDEYREKLNNDFYCLNNIIQEGDYIIFIGEK